MAATGDFAGLVDIGGGRKMYLMCRRQGSPTVIPEASRASRILAIDTTTGTPVAEYVYWLEAADAFDPALEAKDQDEMKLSGLVWLDETTLLALERTNEVARLYAVDMASATNILGSTWDDPATAPSLEALDDPATAGVTPLSKTLVVDLEALPGMPDKIEGVTVIDDQTIAVINDNDFAFGTFDDAGRHQGSGAKSQLLMIEAPASP